MRFCNNISLLSTLVLITSLLPYIQATDNESRLHKRNTTVSASDQELMDKLEGTWTSKSHQVYTGPGFYDPIDELLIEPSLPGISFSFTSDGYWEEARYVVTPNPKEPGCPSAVLIYQHGTYSFSSSNNSLMLYPYAADGRQLLSDPCNDDGISVYSRYENINVIKWFLVEFDDYHGCDRLNLYDWDGSPMQPMYIAYKPPVMLPTQVMNPTSAADTGALGASKKKRGLAGVRERVKRHAYNNGRTNAESRFFMSESKLNAGYMVACGALVMASVLFITV